jgi:esterase/lipase
VVVTVNGRKHWLWRAVDQSRAAQCAVLAVLARYTRSGRRHVSATHQHALIVSGSHDTMLPANNAHATFKAMKNAQLVLYSDSGQGALFQRHELLVRNAQDFLQA